MNSFHGIEKIILRLQTFSVNYNLGELRSDACERFNKK